MLNVKMKVYLCLPLCLLLKSTADTVSPNVKEKKNTNLRAFPVVLSVLEPPCPCPGLSALGKGQQRKLAIGPYHCLVPAVLLPWALLVESAHL